MTAKAEAPPELASADMSGTLSKKKYARQLVELQLRLTRIQQNYLFTGKKAVMVFEGWDAAGKGGTIRRISAALDPRSFKVWPIGAPRNYYLQRHHLLRFMERLPPDGAISAFDRSWYGRVLVERVEKLTPERRWKQGYKEIRDFEQMLIDDGTRLVKLFFHITPEVQLERFRRRLHDPMKRWKLTYEDFRNRDRWDDYAAATDEMFAKTSTATAPWHLIPSNDKRFARVLAITRVVETLENGVDLQPLMPDEKVLEAAEQVMELDAELVASLRGRTE